MSQGKELTEALRTWIRSCRLRSQQEWRERFTSLGLSMSQIGALGILCHQPGAQGVRELGERLRISSAAASQLIERLAQGGMVTRSEDPLDRRARRIAVTEKGRSILEGRGAETPRWIEALVAELSDHEQSAVLSALSILNRAEGRLDQTDARPKASRGAGARRGPIGQASE